MNLPLDALKTKSRSGLNFLGRCMKIGWLPIALIAIFVLQNHLFNLLLDIAPSHYIIRRTVVSIAFGLLIFGPAALMRRKIAYWHLGLAALFVSVIFIFQFLYYSYSGGFLQASAIWYAGEGLTALGTARTLLTYRLIFFALAPLLVLAAAIAARRGYGAPGITLSSREKIGAGGLLVVFAALGYGYILLRERMEAGTTVHLYQRSRLYDMNALVAKIGIINFSLEDAIASAIRPHRATAADLRFIKSWRQTQPPKSDSGKYFGLAKGRNLIFLQVESLENAVIGKKIDGQEITPRLNQLAKEGLYFSNYYAPIGPGTTADVEFSTLNSLYPLPDTAAFIQYAFNQYAALPGLLKKNGYHTYSFHGDVASFWNRANIYPQLGYERWFDRRDYTVPRAIGTYDLGDKDFLQQSIPKLQSMPQPFMATLITLTSHSPFELPPDLETLAISPASPLNRLQRQYLQSIHYTDEAIGTFISQLKSAGLYDNSLIFIFGDHGSFSNISQALGAVKTPFPGLQNFQVPLIILAPRAALRGVDSSPASHLDIYPTAARLLGFSPSSTMFGENLLAQRIPTATIRALISGTVKITLSDKLAYHAADDGVFEHGTCLELPSKKRIAPSACRSLYESQETAVRASDAMVRGNLITQAENF